MQKITHTRNVKFRPRQIILFSIFIFLGFVLDRILKYYFDKALPKGEYFNLFHFFSFELHQNTGMAFGIQIPVGIITAIGIIILIPLAFSVYYSLKIKRPDMFYPITLIFTGGISNIYDRIFFGYTIDYFHLYPYSFFNLADILIISGCLIALFEYWFPKNKNEISHSAKNQAKE